MNGKPFVNYRQMLAEMASVCPERTAIRDAVRTVTYAGLKQEAESFAALLRETGVRPGDRVALFGGNTADWMTAYFGVSLSGAVCVLMNYGMRDDFGEAILRESGARFLLAGSLPEKSGNPKRIARSAGMSCERILDCHALLEEARKSGVRERAPAEEPDADFIALTSGSSTVPKMVLLTQQSQLYAAWAFDRIAGSRSGRNVFIGHPLYHVLGLQSCIYYLCGGGTVCLSLSFAPEDVADRIVNFGVTDLCGMQGFYTDLNDSPVFREHVAPHAEQCICAGGFSPRIMLARLESRYDKAVFINMYGQTECAPIAINDPRDALEIRAHAAGRLPEDVGIRIADADGVEAKPGQPGEILIRSPGFMKGYASRHSDPETVGGYFATGDVGYLDQAGRLYVQGRFGTEIIREDMHIYPAEIENALEKGTSLKELYIAGVMHPLYGETAVAAVVPEDPAAFSEEETLQLLRRELTPRKAPSYVFCMDAFPRLPNGKVNRNALRAVMRRRYMDRMIAEKARRGLCALSVTIKATVHALPPVEAMLKSLAVQLGYSAGRAAEIAALSRTVLKLSVQSSPGTLNDLKIDVILYPDRMALSFEATGSKYTLRRFSDIRTDVRDILQADDIHFERTKDGAPRCTLDFVYENPAAAVDYLNLEVGETL